MELYEHVNGVDVVQQINIQQLSWLNYVVPKVKDGCFCKTGFVEIGEVDELVYVRRTKSRKTCRRLV